MNSRISPKTADGRERDEAIAACRALHARCKLCESDEAPADAARMAGTTRDVVGDTFTVWRCRHCASLNALEAVDYSRIYRAYPIQRQRFDFFTRRLLAKRLRILVDAGLQRADTVLDYGCGSGHFVQYLREHGYDAEGFDPYSEVFCDQGVLAKRYDCVVSQDVIEHADRPADFVALLLPFVAATGRLVIGTPYADNIDIHDPIDQVGVLHQPFHRSIVSMSRARTLFSPSGWKLARLTDASYVDTAWPFANSAFLFRLFRSGDGTMDFAFDPVSAAHLVRHPGLVAWGLFGRLFARRQNLIAVVVAA